MDCKYCNIEEEWKHNESKHPSQEVLGNFHLVPRKRSQALLISAIRSRTRKTPLSFTSERLKSPKSLQRSQTVFSPTSRMTKRPTNFTPRAPARFTPVSTSHRHQGAVKGLKSKEVKEMLKNMPNLFLCILCTIIHNIQICTIIHNITDFYTFYLFLSKVLKINKWKGWPKKLKIDQHIFTTSISTLQLYCMNAYCYIDSILQLINL